MDASQGPLIACVTQIAPNARQFSQSEAQSFLEDSNNIGAIYSHSQSLNREIGAGIIEASEKMQTTLPSAEVSDAAADPIAVRSSNSGFAAGGTTLLRTTPQQLNATDTQLETYAVLDKGFDQAVSEDSAAVRSSIQVERAAAIGVDDRIRVGDKTVFPWFLIGQLIVTWKDGTQSICTGTLVSSHVVLTAGQCAHNRERGGFATKASFAPGQGQSVSLGAVTQPNGIRFADYVETNNRWTQVSGGQTIQTLDTRSDYAAYYFITPWNLASSYMPIVYGDTTSGTFNTAGYPIEVVGAKAINQDMSYSSGSETARSVNLLRAFQVREFSIDVSAGQNGAPIWTFDGVSRSIVGVVSYGGDEVAGGVWFGGENQVGIRPFIEWTPSKPAPGSVSDSLRLSVAFSSGDFSSDSYLRFYNPSPQTGSVIVSFYDGEAGALLATWVSPTLPAFSSRQFAVQILEAEAVPRLQAGTSSKRYTLGIQPTFQGYFQHVVWNRIGASLTNLSGCGNGSSTDVIHMNNVHSTLISDYPSAIFAHNVGDKPVDAVVAVYNSETGARIGGIRIPAVPANAAAVFYMNEVEAALGILPVVGTGPYHFNLVQEGDFPGYLQHFVYNNIAGVITNMSSKCAVTVY